MAMAAAAAAQRRRRTVCCLAAALGASAMMDLFMARPLDLRRHAVVVSSMLGKLKDPRSPDWSKLFTRGLKFNTAEGASCVGNWVPRSGVGERASGGVLQQSGPSLDFHSDPVT